MVDGILQACAQALPKGGGASQNPVNHSGTTRQHALGLQGFLYNLYYD